MNVARYYMYVDGNNLDGMLKNMGLRVDDYGAFYQYCFDRSVEHYIKTFSRSSKLLPTCQLSRVLWFVVGSIDEWNLDDPRSISFLRANYKGLPAGFDLYMNEARDWYNGKVEALTKRKRFYHGVSSGTDCLEMVLDGHWRVDFLNEPLTLSEKGVDTSLAVAMCSNLDNYDVGLVLSNDADCLPSIRYARSKGKHIGVLNFVGGTGGGVSTNNISVRLSVGSDFVVQILESELLRNRIAYRW